MKHRRGIVMKALLAGAAVWTFAGCTSGVVTEGVEPTVSGKPPVGVEPTASGSSSNPDSGSPNPGSPATLLSGKDPKNARFRAVGQTITSGGRCTGSFVKTSARADAPAYVLTAGHCSDFPLQKSMYHDVSIDKEMAGTVQFNTFVDSDGGEINTSIRRIAYATMKGKDVALLELDRTIAELAALGIEPLPLANSSPAAGSSIQITGIPLEYDGGLYKEVYLRASQCKEGDSRANVVEHYWYWYDIHANHCSGMGPGASGAPVFDELGRIFGVFNTHFSGSKPPAPCYLDYPCEVGGGKPERGLDGTGYAVDITGITSCFNASGRFDLQAPGCVLDPGRQASVDEIPPRILAPTHGDPPQASVWAVRLSSSSLTHYRYKVGSVQTVDCRVEEGYSAPIKMDDDRLARLPVPAQEGLHAMCILAGSGAVGEATWQSLAYPTVIVEKTRNSTRAESGIDRMSSTPEQAFDIANGVIALYRNQEKEHQARFSPVYGKTLTTYLAIEPDRSWNIQLGFDLLKRDLTPPDVVALIMCHEVGHALGGFPFKHGVAQKTQAEGLKSNQFGTVSAAEGQADYFATKECLPRLWATESKLNARFRLIVPEHAKARCDSVWGDPDAQNLCYRLAAAALGLGRYIAGFDGARPMPQLDTPDPAEVPGTWYEKNLLQCRVDTLFQGGLCRIKFKDPIIPGLRPPYELLATVSPHVEAAAAVYSCTEGLGARPRCWFKPNATPFDCSGFPEQGKCNIINGQSAQQSCDIEMGIQTFVCPPAGNGCQVDSDGFPGCS